MRPVRTRGPGRGGREGTLPDVPGSARADGEDAQGRLTESGPAKRKAPPKRGFGNRMVTVHALDSRISASPRLSANRVPRASRAWRRGRGAGAVEAHIVASKASRPATSPRGPS